MSKDKNGNVKFVRIRGRVVPIKMKSSDVGYAAGHIAGGAAVATASGYAASNLNRFAAVLRKKAAFEFGTARRIMGVLGGSKGPEAAAFFKKSGATAKLAKGAVDTAVLQRSSSMLLRRFRRPLMFTGAAVGAGIAYKGASRLINKAEIGENQKPYAKAALAAGAAGIASLAYYKGHGLSVGTAYRYAKGLATGKLSRLPRIAINTRFGPLIFRK